METKLLYLSKKISFLVFLLIGLSVLVTKSYAYDRVHINNYSTSKGVVVVEYAGCKTDVWNIEPAMVVRNGIQPSSSHAPVSRGGCLVTQISARFGEYVTNSVRSNPFQPPWVWKGNGSEVDSYRSSGTSYVNFSIVQRSDTRFRIMSDAEIQRENEDPKNKSPGFKIWNNTIWPLSIALSQVGCLYYDTIKPGQFFERNTGAVWFTIQANISKDGTETRTNWDCALPVVEVVGSIAFTALTGGVFGIAGVAIEETTFAAGAYAGAQVATASWLIEMGKELAATSEGSLKGQYAGPPYPFRCTHKPEYKITGGWGAPTKNEKGEPVIPPGTPLQIEKIANGC